MNVVKFLIEYRDYPKPECGEEMSHTKRVLRFMEIEAEDITVDTGLVCFWISGFIVAVVKDFDRITTFSPLTYESGLSTGEPIHGGKS